MVIVAAVSVIVGLLTLAAESVHALRIRRTARLLFGPAGSPLFWARLTPLVRAAAVGGLTWALLTLMLILEPEVHASGTTRPVPPEQQKHVVLVLDVSPSMKLPDAGPEGDLSRLQRAHHIMTSFFRRVNVNEYRVSVIAVYTDAKPVVEDTRDLAVVDNILNDLPMEFAFVPGDTDLFAGLEAAAEKARGYRPRSTTVILVSDGDTVPATGMPGMPPAVAEVLVVGVGDPRTGSFINGRNSKQDVSTLRQIATRLGGTYHDGNALHLSTSLVTRLTEQMDNPARDRLTLRDAALLTAVAAALTLAVWPMLLHYLGTFWMPGVRRTDAAGDFQAGNSARSRTSVPESMSSGVS